MTSPPPDIAATYELRLAARLDEHWAAWFDGFTLTRHEDGSTTLHGTVIDQAELHGLLAKVRDLGVPLISLTPITPAHHDTAADSR